jgi:hypothetical protein
MSWQEAKDHQEQRKAHGAHVWICQTSRAAQQWLAEQSARDAAEEMLQKNGVTDG